MWYTAEKCFIINSAYGEMVNVTYVMQWNLEWILKFFSVINLTAVNRAHICSLDWKRLIFSSIKNYKCEYF